MQSGEGFTIYDSAMYVSKFMGFRININEITVIEFYTYLKGIEKWQK
jgi:hypothetical protein